MSLTDDVVERMARAARGALRRETPNFWHAPAHINIAVRAALSALGPELRIVPVKPTEAMLDAGVKDHRHEQSYAGASETWEAMLAAAPSLPHEDAGDE